jgi:hypothetical protein
MTEETAFDFCEPVTAGGLVAYLRRGRKRWGRGQITGVYADGSVKMLPARAGWKTIVITPEELNAIAKPGAQARPEPGPRREKPLVEVVSPEEVESYWWPLWKHLHEEHGLILLESECVEIARAVDEVRRKDLEKSA